MTWSDLGDMRTDHWSQFSDSGCKPSCHPMFECFEWFPSKRGAFQFSPVGFGKVTKWAWPYDTDIKIRCRKGCLSKRDIPSIDTVMDSNRWKFQNDRFVGVATTSTQAFSKVRSLGVTCCPDFKWPGSEIFTSAERMYEQVYKKRTVDLRSNLRTRQRKSIERAIERDFPRRCSSIGSPGIRRVFENCWNRQNLTYDGL